MAPVFGGQKNTVTDRHGERWPMVFLRFFCSMFFFPTVEGPVTFTIIHLSADLTLRIQCSAFLLEIFVSDSGASLGLHGNLCCTAFSGKLSRWRTAKLLGLVVGSEDKI